DDAGKFLPTPSARRATKIRLYEKCRTEISTHALREEGDTPSRCSMVGGYQFLPTPSARRATRPAGAAWAVDTNFYPRPPRGGRRAYNLILFKSYIFLPTPSARRATPKL